MKLFQSVFVVEIRKLRPHECARFLSVIIGSELQAHPEVAIELIGDQEIPEKLIVSSGHLGANHQTEQGVLVHVINTTELFVEIRDELVEDLLRDALRVLLPVGLVHGLPEFDNLCKVPRGTQVIDGQLMLPSMKHEECHREGVGAADLIIEDLRYCPVVEFLVVLEEVMLKLLSQILQGVALAVLCKGHDLNVEEIFL